MTLDHLAAGIYTVVLSDGQYIANAIFDNGRLGVTVVSNVTLPTAKKPSRCLSLRTFSPS